MTAKAHSFRWSGIQKQKPELIRERPDYSPLSRCCLFVELRISLGEGQ